MTIKPLNDGESELGVGQEDIRKKSEIVSCQSRLFKSRKMV